MRVYLVYDEYESPPYGVFSTEEKATEYISNMLRNLEKNLGVTLSPSSYFIDAEDVDPTFTSK